jgi:hypothetical protein
MLTPAVRFCYSVRFRNTVSFCYSVLFRNTVQSCCIISRHLNRWLFNSATPSCPGLVCNNDTCHAAGASGVDAASLGTPAHSLGMLNFDTLLGFCAVLLDLCATHPRQAPQSTTPAAESWSDPAKPPLWRAGGNSGPALASLIAAPGGRVWSPTWPDKRIQSDFTRSIFGRRRRLLARRPFFRQLPHFGVSLCSRER